MTRREELKKRLEALENRKFYLAMKDRWSAKDYEIDRELFNEILAIEKELKEI